MSRYDPTAVAIEELRTFGIEPTQVRRSGSGHYKIYFFLNDREQFIVVAATPSDCRAQHNNRAVLRKIIRRATGLCDACFRKRTSPTTPCCGSDGISI